MGMNMSRQEAEAPQVPVQQPKELDMFRVRSLVTQVGREGSKAASVFGHGLGASFGNRLVVASLIFSIAWVTGAIIIAMAWISVP